MDLCNFNNNKQTITDNFFIKPESYDLMIKKEKSRKKKNKPVKEDLASELDNVDENKLFFLDVAGDKQSIVENKYVDIVDSDMEITYSKKIGSVIGTNNFKHLHASNILSSINSLPNFKNKLNLKEKSVSNESLAAKKDNELFFFDVAGDKKKNELNLPVKNSQNSIENNKFEVNKDKKFSKQSVIIPKKKKSTKHKHNEEINQETFSNTIGTKFLIENSKNVDNNPQETEDLTQDNIKIKKKKEKNSNKEQDYNLEVAKNIKEKFLEESVLLLKDISEKSQDIVVPHKKKKKKNKHSIKEKDEILFDVKQPEEDGTQIITSTQVDDFIKVKKSKKENKSSKKNKIVNFDSFHHLQEIASTEIDESLNIIINDLEKIKKKRKHSESEIEEHLEKAKKIREVTIPPLEKLEKLDSPKKSNRRKKSKTIAANELKDNVNENLDSEEQHSLVSPKKQKIDESKIEMDISTSSKEVKNEFGGNMDNVIHSEEFNSPKKSKKKKKIIAENEKSTLESHELVNNPSNEKSPDLFSLKESKKKKKLKMINLNDKEMDISTSSKEDKNVLGGNMDNVIHSEEFNSPKKSKKKKKIIAENEKSTLESHELVNNPPNEKSALESKENVNTSIESIINLEKSPDLVSLKESKKKKKLKMIYFNNKEMDISTSSKEDKNEFGGNMDVIHSEEFNSPKESKKERKYMIQEDNSTAEIYESNNGKPNLGSNENGNISVDSVTDLDKSRYSISPKGSKKKKKIKDSSNVFHQNKLNHNDSIKELDISILSKEENTEFASNMNDVIPSDEPSLPKDSEEKNNFVVQEDNSTPELHESINISSKDKSNLGRDENICVESIMDLGNSNEISDSKLANSLNEPEIKEESKFTEKETKERNLFDVDLENLNKYKSFEEYLDSDAEHHMITQLICEPSKKFNKEHFNKVVKDKLSKWKKKEKKKMKFNDEIENNDSKLDQSMSLDSAIDLELNERENLLNLEKSITEEQKLKAANESSRCEDASNAIGQFKEKYSKIEKHSNSSISHNNSLHINEEDDESTEEKIDLISLVLNKKVTEEESPSLQELFINLPNEEEIPPLHRIKRPSKATSDEIKLAKQLNAKVGPYTKQEDEIIIKNWENFCKNHNCSLKPEVFFKFPKNISKVQKIKFLQYISLGLKDRTPFNVHYRFKNLFRRKICKYGRFSQEEDEQIMEYVLESYTKTPFQDLAIILNRPHKCIEQRFRKLMLSENNVIRWDTPTSEKLIKEMMKILGTENVKDLKTATFDGDEWQKLSRFMNISVVKLRSAWKVTVYPRLFMKEKLRDVRIRLIDMLIENNEKDIRGINWKNYTKYFKGVTDLKLLIILENLLAHIPKEYTVNLQDALIYIREHQSSITNYRQIRYKFKNGKLFAKIQKENEK